MVSRPRILFVHRTPTAFGGSEIAMCQDAVNARRLGWEPVLLYGDGRSSALLAKLFAAAVSMPEAFDGTRRRVQWAIDAVRAALGPVQLVHAHYWGGPELLRSLCELAPTLATCHLPLCPNGARYLYRHERACDRRSGAVCLVRGYLGDGCAHTADLVPFAWPALARALARAKREVAALDRCSYVIAPSTWQRDRLQREGVGAERLVVCSPAPSPRQAPEPLEAPAPVEPVLLMLARLVRFKGAHHLIRAARGMSTPHELWIGGEGPERPRLERLAEELDEPVRFLGPLNGGRRESAFAAASAMVVPSLWPETFGLTGPEAALRGLPTVAYLQAGVHDWLRRDRDIGVPPGDVEALTTALDTVLSRPPRPVAPDVLRLKARAVGELYAAAAGLSAFG